MASVNNSGKKTQTDKSLWSLQCCLDNNALISTPFKICEGKKTKKMCTYNLKFT